MSKCCSPHVVPVVKVEVKQSVSLLFLLWLQIDINSTSFALQKKSFENMLQ